jgi:phosphoribosyl 1,2-cyclic phosphate phosphodiesterase
MKITMLGCGPSTGIPAIGGVWGDCNPADPRNRRRRSSLLIECRGKVILVDTSPDMRVQLLDAGVTQLDAVILTHAHADHLHGIDDLRSINRLIKKPIPFFANAYSLAEMRRRFDYIFELPPAQDPFYKPSLEPHAIDGPFIAAGLAIVPFTQDHGFSTTLGLRIGSFGYSTDVTELDETAFAALAGIELWIVDCLRYEPHPTHSHLEKTLGWVARLKPHRAVLTHMDRQLDYAELAARLPAGIEPGQDGLVIEVPDP